MPVSRVHPKAPIGALFVFGRPWWILLLAIPLLTAWPAFGQDESAVVRYVIDGDTLILRDERTVRLIGLNAPELGRDGIPDQPLAAEARARLRQLVEGKTVRLIPETEQRDHYGRWLAHPLLADGYDPAEILIREGLASAVAIPPNVREFPRYQSAERAARQERRGIWGQAVYRPVPAAQLSETGFRLVRGRVTRIGKSRKYLYLDLGPHLAVRIAHANWERYFPDRPEDWRGTNVEARGWITRQDDRWSLRVGHPGMLVRLP